MAIDTTIRVYDLGTNMTSMTMVAIIHKYSAAYIERSWSGVGKFQIELDPRLTDADELTIDRLVVFGSDLKKCGIITDRKRSFDAGSERLVVSGVELKGILAWRIVTPATGDDAVYATDKAETIIKNLIKNQLGALATDTNRRCTLVDVAADQARGANYTVSSRYSSLLSECVKASEATGLGFYAYLNIATSKIVFECGVGINRVASQSVNGRAIFSKKFMTIESFEASKNAENYRNLVVVAGQGQGTKREIVSTTNEGSTPTDLKRRELFVDARDLAATADLAPRGLAKLAENATQVYVSGTALTYSNLVFGVDYDLGDICTIEGFDETIDSRITTVSESWSADGYKVDLTFGIPYPNVIDKITTDIEVLSDSTNTSVGESAVLTTTSSGATMYEKKSNGVLDIYGWDYCYSAGLVAYILKTVTFPVQFKDAEIEILTSAIGRKTVSAPTSRDDIIAAEYLPFIVSPRARTVSNFVAVATYGPGSNLGGYILFSWHAHGYWK